MAQLLNQKQLEAAVTVMRLGTVTRAAEDMHLTQPAISRLIAQLEQRLGFSLFERQGGRLVANRRGLRFLEEADRLISDTQQLARLGEELKWRRDESIDVIAVPSLAQTLLPDALKRLSAEGELRVNITTAQRHDVRRLLAQRRFDLGVVTLPVAVDTMEVEHVATIGAVCIMHESHPLAAKGVVEVREMVEQVFIAPGQSTLLVRRLEDVLAREGLPLRPHMTVETTAVIHQLAARNLGISIGHAFSAFDRPPNVVMRPITPEIPLDYALLLPEVSRRKAGTIRLAEIIREAIQDLSKANPSAERPGTWPVRRPPEET